MNILILNSFESCFYLKGLGAMSNFYHFKIHLIRLIRPETLMRLYLKDIKLI